MSKDLVKTFSEIIEIENVNTKSLRESTALLKNALVKELLGSIAHDSAKHADMYSSLITYLSGPSTAMTEEEFEMLEKVVRRHIELEEDMINRLENLTGSGAISDKKITYVLRYILFDEYRHHSLLKGLLEAIVRKEVITEEDWWDMVWKDVPFHGTPGG